MKERERRFDRALRGPGATRAPGDREWHVDRVLAGRLAGGPSTRAGLLAAGVSPDAIDRRLVNGHLPALNEAYARRLLRVGCRGLCRAA